MFDRWGLWKGQTWALHVFRKHHTEINDLYWSMSPLFRHASREHRANPTTPPLALFGLKPTDRHDIGAPIDWRASLKDAENWVRLSALIAATSYLEIFVKKATTLSLESDPGVEHGKPRAVDGFIFRKQNKNYDRSDAASGCWIGTWQQRVSEYGRLFGSVPDYVTDNITELDGMRRMRNGVGHTFGRDVGAYDSHTIVSPPAMARLSEARLQKWLGIVEGTARAIDEHLGPTHIGEYEALCYFHSFRMNRQGQPHDGWPGYIRSQIGALFGTSPGRPYARGLVSFYNGI